MGRMILIPGADYSGVSLGTVTPVGGIPIEGITIKGPGAAYGYADYSAKLWPTFTDERDYTWSIVSGDTHATINATTGRLTVAAGSSADPVTIRCTSIDDPNVYAEKTVLCSSGTLVYYDYLVSDGSTYVLIDRFPSLVDATVTIRYTTGPTPNGYLLSNRVGDTLNQATNYALYLRDNGNSSRVAPGTKGTADIKSSGGTTIRYRAVMKLSSLTSLADAYFVAYNDATDEQLVRYDTITCYLESYFCIWSLCYASSVITPATVKSENNGDGKFYGMTVEKEGVTIGDFRPCTIDGTPCIIDYVSGLTYYSATGSGLTAGND